MNIHSFIIILLFSFLYNGLLFSQTGLYVYDGDTDEDLIGVTIILAEDMVLISDERGTVLIDTAIHDSPYQISVRYVGYDHLDTSIYLVQDSILPIALRPLTKALDEVLILEDHAKHEGSLSSVHLSESYFEKINSGTLAKDLSRVPGIQSIDMGPGISKPVIRGLHGNRIIVNKDYIKQEGHQWGMDHGLELDPFDANRIEIVKGPSALQYGSDGLGGAINILPNKLPQNNTLEGQFQTLYKTNNNHRAASLYLGKKWTKWFLTGRVSYQAYDDYRVPADSFVYNGFELPIFDQQLKNTAGQEFSINATGGYQSSNQITKLTYNRYQLKGGIFAGAVGMPRSYTLQPDGNSGDVDIPFQDLVHQRLVLNHISFIGKDHFTLNLGYQHNRRNEHSLPESHSQFDIEPNETLAIGLDLQTISWETHYEKKHKTSGRTVLGINGQYQTNTRYGFEFLLPDFTAFRSGIYVFSEFGLTDQSVLSIGGRYDLGHNRSDAFFLERRNRQGQVFAETFVPFTDNIFHNWSGSAGLFYQLDNIVIRSNLAKSFRIPYPNETSSNGIHHGTFRHEIGQADLKSEQGYQLDGNIEGTHNGFFWAVSGYFNYFDNYIYLRPSANFSTLPEAGQLFEYTQNDAIYTGAEVEYRYQMNTWLSIAQSLEYVHTFNIQTQLALPFTPPVTLVSQIESEFEFGAYTLDLGLIHQWTAANGPLRIDRFEQATPAFQLIDFTIRLSSQKWLKGVSFLIEGRNILNTPYLNHLSRYRLLNLPEQGRNIVFSLRLSF